MSFVRVRRSYLSQRAPPLSKSKGPRNRVNSTSRLSVLLVNVHLYFGAESKKDLERSALETAGVDRWGSETQRESLLVRARSVALGELNMLKGLRRTGAKSPMALFTNKGLELPSHSSEVASSITSDTYDQVVTFPERCRICFVQMGVYDFNQVAIREPDDEPKTAFFLLLAWVVSCCCE